MTNFEQAVEKREAFQRELSYKQEIEKPAFTAGLIWGLVIGGAITTIIITWPLIF